MLQYLKFRQDHVANGQFSSIELINRDYNPDSGQRIECSLADRTGFGYRKGAAAPAPTAAPAAEAAPAG